MSDSLIDSRAGNAALTNVAFAFSTECVDCVLYRLENSKDEKGYFSELRFVFREGVVCVEPSYYIRNY